MMCHAGIIKQGTTLSSNFPFLTFLGSGWECCDLYDLLGDDGMEGSNSSFIMTKSGVDMYLCVTHFGWDGHALHNKTLRKPLQTSWRHNALCAWRFYKAKGAGAYIGFGGRV